MIALCRYQLEQAIIWTETGISEDKRYLMETYSAWKPTELCCWTPPLLRAALCSLQTGCFQKMEKVHQFFIQTRPKLKAPPYSKAICKPWTAKGTHSVSAVNSQQLSLTQAARPVLGTLDSALMPARRTSQFVLVRATSGLKCLKLNTVFASFVIKMLRSFISASEVHPRVSVRNFWRVPGCLTFHLGR